MRNLNRKGLWVWLETFNTAIEASKSYDRAAFKLRGSKAILKLLRYLWGMVLCFERQKEENEREIVKISRTILYRERS
ncbi:hypothetical protein I3843_01G299400 [Carya illinoinensis]|nr:hypothetical protein I3843_01G299400 [Carya illinoinensis]